MVTRERLELQTGGASAQCWAGCSGLMSDCVCTGKVKKELDHDDNHLNLDETTKLLQDLHEAQAERGGSRPSSNLSSLSNASDRDHPHLGKAAPALRSAPTLQQPSWSTSGGHVREEGRSADFQERLETPGLRAPSPLPSWAAPAPGAWRTRLPSQAAALK